MVVGEVSVAVGVVLSPVLHESSARASDRRPGEELQSGQAVLLLLLQQEFGAGVGLKPQQVGQTVLCSEGVPVQGGHVLTGAGEGLEGVEARSLHQPSFPRAERALHVVGGREEEGRGGSGGGGGGGGGQTSDAAGREKGGHGRVMKRVGRRDGSEGQVRSGVR